MAHDWHGRALDSGPCAAPARGIPAVAPSASFSRETLGDTLVTAPRRVKVEGDLFHGQAPDGAVYVGRAAPGLKRSRFANPYAVKGRDRAEAIRLYREHLTAHPGLIVAARAELAGRDLACWCKLSDPCHAEILLAISNGWEVPGNATSA